MQKARPEPQGVHLRCDPQGADLRISHVQLSDDPVVGLVEVAGRDAAAGLAQAVAVVAEAIGRGTLPSYHSRSGCPVHEQQM